MTSASAPVSIFLPCLSVFPDFLQWWTGICKFKPTKPFPPQLTLWSGCFKKLHLTRANKFKVSEYSSNIQVLTLKKKSLWSKQPKSPSLFLATSGRCLYSFLPEISPSWNPKIELTDLKIVNQTSVPKNFLKMGRRVYHGCFVKITSMTWLSEEITVTQEHPF